MTKSFQTLTRMNTRKLKAGEKLQEGGIIFTRLPNGDGRFSVCIMVDGQRIHRVVGNESTGTTRQTAELFISRIQLDSRDNRLNLPKGRKTQMTFKEACLKYLGKINEEKDYKHKERRIRLHLMPFFKNFPLSKISTFDIERYKRERLKRPLLNRVEGLASTGSVNRELAILSHIFNKSMEWGYTEKIPCKIKKFPESSGRSAYLSREQIKKVLHYAELDGNQHIYPYMYIALHTAMRHMEILRLKREDIDFARKVLHIREAKAGAREQPMSSELAEFLADFLRCHTSEFLFPSPKSCTGHLKEIRKPFGRVITKAGLDPKQIVRHTLRHTVITHLVQAGVDLPTVKNPLAWGRLLGMHVLAQKLPSR